MLIKSAFITPLDFNTNAQEGLDLTKYYHFDLKKNLFK